MGAGRDVYGRSLKERGAVEFLSDRVYRPMAHLVVRLVLPTPVRPEHLVLVQGFLGALAALFVARGADLAAALLLVLRSILDNADGQLARARRQTSQLGRYLDTEVDLVTNLLVFLALGLRTGRVGLAFLSFLLLVLLLSADYALNSPKTLPEARGAEPWASRLEAFYRAFFGPQDAFFARLFARGAPHGYRTFLANLGLSTQHTLLALFLLLGAPEGYLLAVVLAFLLASVGYLFLVWRTPSPPSPPSRSGPRGGSSS